MIAQVYVCVTVDNGGEHPSHTVFTREEDAVSHILSRSSRYKMRPNAVVHRRHHANVITVESDDWKLGYVILARVAH